MVRKPARMYNHLAKTAYCRRQYMGGVPGVKVVQFDMGNLSAEFPVAVHLEAIEGCQIRHTAMEAARINMNRRLMSSIGKNDFHLKIRTYPHHVLREHKYATGAGADRVSEGMRLAFGKPVGTAARVAPRQKVFTIWTKKQYIEQAKDALLHAGYKLPTPVRVVVEE